MYGALTGMLMRGMDPGSSQERLTAMEDTLEAQKGQFDAAGKNRLVMAMAKTRRMVAVLSVTRSPGRVATRPDNVGSQCSILGPLKTHLCLSPASG